MPGETDGRPPGHDKNTDNSQCPAVLHPQTLWLLLVMQRLQLDTLSSLRRSLGYIHPSQHTGSSGWKGINGCRQQDRALFTVEIPFSRQPPVTIPCRRRLSQPFPIAPGTELRCASPYGAIPAPELCANTEHGRCPAMQIRSRRPHGAAPMGDSRDRRGALRAPHPRTEPSKKPRGFSDGLRHARAEGLPPALLPYLRTKLFKDALNSSSNTLAMPWRPMLLNAGPQTFPVLQRKKAKGILLVLQSAYLAFYHRSQCFTYLINPWGGWGFPSIKNSAMRKNIHIWRFFSPPKISESRASAEATNPNQPRCSELCSWSFHSPAAACAMVPIARLTPQHSSH